MAFNSSSKLLINEPPLQVLPSLAVKIGLNEAVILQQVHYWLNPKFNKNIFEGRYWVHNTYEQWQEQFPFWSEKTIRRAIENLEKKGLLLSFLTKEFKKVKYYTIDYDALDHLQNSEPVDQDHFHKKPGNPGIPPSGHFDPIDTPKRADREGQNDPIDRVKMTSSYNYTENTHKNTLPPLTPPSSIKQKKDEDEEEEVSKKMVEIWNETVHTKISSTKGVLLTLKRRQKLYSLMDKLFDRDMEAWRNYCSTIASCRFLMGESPGGFKVTLDWAINSDNACKVLEGAIYDKPLKEEKITSSEAQDIDTPEIGQEFRQPWAEVASSLIQKLGKATYRCWIGKIFPLKLEDNTLTLQAPNSFMKDWITTYYLDDLKTALKQVYSFIPEICWETIQKPQFQAA